MEGGHTVAHEAIRRKTTTGLCISLYNLHARDKAHVEGPCNADDSEVLMGG